MYKKDLQNLEFSNENIKCSASKYFFDIMGRFDGEIQEYQKNKEPIQPRFESGSYHDSSDNHKIVFQEKPNPFLLTEGVLSNIGYNVLARFGNNSDYILKLPTPTKKYLFSFVVHTSKYNFDFDFDIVENVFSRIQLVARISKDDAQQFLEYCKQAIQYWEKRLENFENKNNGINEIVKRLQIFMDIFARLLVYAKPDEAKNAFKMAMEFGESFIFKIKNSSSFEKKALFQFKGSIYQRLINSSLKSIPKDQCNELLKSSLEFPFIRDNIRNGQILINPVILDLNKRDFNNIKINQAIEKLIQQINLSDIHLSFAILSRLSPLAKKNRLTEDELKIIQEKIWKDEKMIRSFIARIYNPSLLLDFKFKNKNDLEKLIRDDLFKDFENLPTSDLERMRNLLEKLAKIINLAKNKLFPNKEQAKYFFEKLIHLKFTEENKKDISFSWKNTQKIENNLMNLIAKAMSFSIIPSLSNSELTKENFNKIHEFYSTTNSSSIILSFIYFRQLENNEAIFKIIKKELRSLNHEKVTDASKAILEWKRKLVEFDKVEKPKKSQTKRKPNTENKNKDESQYIDQLIQKAIDLIENTSITSFNLLYLVNEFYKEKWIKKEEISKIIEVLPEIFNNTDYKLVCENKTGSDLVLAPLIRAECVKLAESLIDNKEEKIEELIEILKKAKDDPLPEVRFAATEKLKFDLND